MMTAILLIMSLLVNTNWVTANMAVTANNTQHTYYICDECADIYFDITDADGVWLDDEAVFICAKHFATATYQSCSYSYTYDVDSVIDNFENDGDSIVFKDCDGNNWLATLGGDGTSCYTVGDAVTVVFDDNGTPDNVLDDTVVSVSVNGSTFDVCYCELLDD